jgi:hypothetical protein
MKHPLILSLLLANAALAWVAYRFSDGDGESGDFILSFIAIFAGLVLDVSAFIYWLVKG